MVTSNGRSFIDAARVPTSRLWRSHHVHFLPGVVAAVADELPTPFSKRQRLAKARIQVFEEITKDIRHEFFHLKDQIKGLKLEIEALSPALFKLNSKSNAPIPHAISALPDDPKQLKQLLANFYVEANTEARKAREYKRLSKQHEKLYNAASLYNEELQAKLALKEAD